MAEKRQANFYWLPELIEAFDMLAEPYSKKQRSVIGVAALLWLMQMKADSPDAFEKLIDLCGAADFRRDYSELIRLAREGKLPTAWEGKDSSGPAVAGKIGQDRPRVAAKSAKPRGVIRRADTEDTDPDTGK